MKGSKIKTCKIDTQNRKFFVKNLSCEFLLLLECLY